MGYLITNDYQRIIQTTELNAITTNSVITRQLVEQSTQTEIQQYLIQRFDMAREFQNLSSWSPLLIYKATQRVYLDAAPYDPTLTYFASAKKMVLQSGNVYLSFADTISPAGTFDPSKWTLLGAQYQMFFVSFPQPEFNVDKFYHKGDQVWWRDYTYIAQTDSIPIDQQAELQAPSIEDIRFGNVLPDQGRAGFRMWGAATPFSLAAGTLPTDPAWTTGDNRNQALIEMFMDIVVYKLCKRIAPNNVPEARHNAWLKAVKDLKAFAMGDLNAQLPEIIPVQGNKVFFGGQPPKQYDVW